LFGLGLALGLGFVLILGGELKEHAPYSVSRVAYLIMSHMYGFKLHRLPRMISIGLHSLTTSLYFQQLVKDA